jgi:hypothetical protein
MNSELSGHSNLKLPRLKKRKMFQNPILIFEQKHPTSFMDIDSSLSEYCFPFDNVIYVPFKSYEHSKVGNVHCFDPQYLLVEVDLINLESRKQNFSSRKQLIEYLKPVCDRFQQKHLYSKSGDVESDVESDKEETLIFLNHLNHLNFMWTKTSSNFMWNVKNCIISNLKNELIIQKKHGLGNCNYARFYNNLLFSFTTEKTRVEQSQGSLGNHVYEACIRIRGLWKQQFFKYMSEQVKTQSVFLFLVIRKKCCLISRHLVYKIFQYL